MNLKKIVALTLLMLCSGNLLAAEVVCGKDPDYFEAAHTKLNAILAAYTNVVVSQPTMSHDQSYYFMCVTVQPK